MLVFQKMIFRADLRANPNVLYVFGDNVMRQGFGGQAGEMRGEPNAVGVATKIKPFVTDDSYFSDERYDEITRLMTADLDRVRQHLTFGGVVVWPLDGIGTGLSKLPQRAPRINEWLNTQIGLLKQIASS